jgi:hypothetical protein
MGWDVEQIDGECDLSLYFTVRAGQLPGLWFCGRNR